MAGWVRVPLHRCLWMRYWIRPRTTHALTLSDVSKPTTNPSAVPRKDREYTKSSARRVIATYRIFCLFASMSAAGPRSSHVQCLFYEPRNQIRDREKRTPCHRCKVVTKGIVMNGVGSNVRAQEPCFALPSCSCGSHESTPRFILGNPPEGAQGDDLVERHSLGRGQIN